MTSISKWLGSAVVSLSLLTAAGTAPAATQTFEFRLDTTTVAFGSFSYSDSATGVLSFSDLSAFNLSVNVPAIYQGGLPRIFTYDLATILGYPTSPTPAGRYFGFDTATNQFVSSFDANPSTALPWFGGGSFYATMAAYSGDPQNGFFIDWRAPGADGKSGFAVMETLQDKSVVSGAVNWNNYQVSAVSEPSSFALAAAGLALISFVAGKRRRS